MGIKSLCEQSEAQLRNELAQEAILNLLSVESY